MVESGEEATGLVPGLAYQPSSTILGSERVVMVLVLEKKRLGLSNDEDASGDESGCWNLKRWEEDVGSDCCQSKTWMWVVGRYR